MRSGTPRGAGRPNLAPPPLSPPRPPRVSRQVEPAVPIHRDGRLPVVRDTGNGRLAGGARRGAQRAVTGDVARTCPPASRARTATNFALLRTVSCVSKPVRA